MSTTRQPTEKIEKLQAHVAEVSNIMTENINKILDRGQRLDDLEGRSGESLRRLNLKSDPNFSYFILFITEVLASSADDFRVSSRRVSRKMWWQNMKFNIIIGIVVVSIIVIIVVSVTSK